MQKRSASLTNSFLVVGEYSPDMEVLFRKIDSKMKGNLILEKMKKKEKKKKRKKKKKKKK